MPLTAMEPKRTMPAPPRTGIGTSETTAPSTGKAPRIRSAPPAAATTYPAAYAGQGDDADVLGEGAGGKGTEDRTEEGGDAVGAQPPGDGAAVGATVADLAEGDHPGGGFRHQDEHDDAQGQDRGGLELRCAEGEGGRQGGERCGLQRGEVGEPERDRG